MSDWRDWIYDHILLIGGLSFGVAALIAGLLITYYSGVF